LLRPSRIMRYAFITDELPRPGFAGHLAMNFAVVSWLRDLGHEVVVVLVGARLALPVVRYGVATVVGPRVRGVAGLVVAGSPLAVSDVAARAVLRRLRVRRPGADAVLGRFMTAAEVRWCADYVLRTRPDAVLVDTIFRAGVLAVAGMAAFNSVVVAHDVFFRRHAALASAGYRVQPVVLSQDDEAAWLCGARHIAAIQPEEAGILAGMCPAQNVFVAPMPALPCPPPSGVLPPGRVVFMGSASLPNLDGLRWFFDEVWPLLPAGRVALDLVGDCGAALRSVPAGVRRRGRVADIAPVLHGAALAVAPLRVGSGLKIKILDYARHGLHTIVTPASLAGFAPDAAAPFTVAADAAGFAAAILQHVDRPPAPGLACDYIGRHYGVAASFAALRLALRA
jgi:succinoglycan biosynthesis protein ExoO